MYLVHIHMNNGILVSGSAVQMFGGAVSILARSLVSKTVDVEEVGKAFVVFGNLEAVL
jgi:hypothetical protein